MVKINFKICIKKDKKIIKVLILSFKKSFKKSIRYKGFNFKIYYIFLNINFLGKGSKIGIEWNIFSINYLRII